MSILEKLRDKYKFSNGKYEPNPACKFCHGTGERNLKDGKQTFCICLYVNHVHSDWCGDTLGELAKKLINENKEGNQNENA